ncbi:ATP-binding protein [Streptomyces halstedii]|uniref:ATP-binding protein n=1 Tax=Streptomyces halstedii TaxID=1944 RepID=A0ABS6U111_STRHA|nr:ATP-binding protein [Streptomyces halstedii]MBV7674221.1 ATP-binding protein [Streptomyces halstedii]
MTPLLDPQQCLAELTHSAAVKRVAAAFVSEASSVPAARHFVLRQLSTWQIAEDRDFTDRVALTLSELVTNAVVHGRTCPSDERETFGVALAFKEHFTLGLVVSDNSDSTPHPASRPSGDALCGRGLELVSVSADAWTTTPRQEQCGRGKSVWALFQCSKATGQRAQLPQSA